MNTQITQDAALAIALTTIVLSGFKQLWDATPLAAHLSDGAYNTVLRGVGVLLNLALLCGQLASQGQLDFGHNWYIYLTAALGQQGISHLVYATVKAGAFSAPSATPPPGYQAPNDVKQPLVEVPA